MIYLITLFSSLLIQFGAFSFPTRYDDVNLKYQSITDRLYNDIHNRGFVFDKKYCLVVGNTDNSFGYGYEVFVPLEVLNGSNSNISVSFRAEYDNYGHINTNNTGWIRFKYGTGFNYLFGGYNESATSMSFDVFNVDSSGVGLLYNEYYSLPYQDINSFDFKYVPSISGHTQDGKNEHINAPLPFVNAPSVSGHSSFATVDDSSSNNLLGNILNSIQYGSNSIVNGINNLGSFIGNLWGNINSTINYTLEPLNNDEVMEVLKNSHFNGVFEDLKNIKDSFDDLNHSDHVVISFTLPDTLGGGSYDFDFAQYFDSSKRVWQPLLLTFLYASLVWGFYKGFANMVNGSSPFVSDVHYQFANDRLRREQLSDNHTR